MSVPDEAVRAGETLAITVTMTNPGDRPAAGEISVRTDDTIRLTWIQRLSIGEEATRTVELSFAEPGEYRISAGTESRSVTVTGDTSTTENGDSTAESDPTQTTNDGGATGTKTPVGTPGVGFVAAVVGVLSGVLLARRRELGRP